MGFADAVEGPLQLEDGVDDGAEDADFAVGAGFRDRDDDGVLVDIQADVEYDGAYGAVVSSFSVDESERSPRRIRGRSCGSAHLGNPRSYGRQPHHFFSNQLGQDPVRADSHKV